MGKMASILFTLLMLLSCSEKPVPCDRLDEASEQARGLVAAEGLDDNLKSQFNDRLKYSLEILNEQESISAFLNDQFCFKQLVYVVESGEVVTEFMYYFYEKDEEYLAFFIVLSQDWEVKELRALEEPKLFLKAIKTHRQLESIWSSDYSMIIDLEKNSVVVYENMFF